MLYYVCRYLCMRDRLFDDFRPQWIVRMVPYPRHFIAEIITIISHITYKYEISLGMDY